VKFASHCFFMNTVNNNNNNNNKNNKKTSHCLFKHFFLFLIRNTQYSLVKKKDGLFVENRLLLLQTAPFVLIYTKIYGRTFTLSDLFILRLAKWRSYQLLINY
jgi:hypothetical protein